MSTSAKSIRVTCQGAATLPIEQLVEFQGNLKKLSKKNLEKLKARILEDGFNVPFFVWNHDNTFSLLDGHQRMRALTSLKADGYEIPALPVAYIEASDIADARKKLLAITSQYGEFDSAELEGWLSEMDEGIADTLRIVDGEMDIVLKELEDPEQTEGDDELPEEVEPLTKIGDLWEFGKHRLLCGDSTDIANIDKLMNGKKADMVFTDPPYGMKKENEGVLNDNLNYDDLLEFNRKWIPISFAFTKENGSWYCWGTDEPLMDIYSAIIKPMIKNQKATFRNLITWAKGNGQGQNSENTRSYAIADEKCLFVMCGVQGFNNNADNYFEGWEPIRDYLLDQRLKAGWDIPTMKKIAGHSDLNRDHWTCKSQWNMPTEEVYQSFKQWGIDNNVDVFKREYEDIKREYYSTRAYFNNVHDNFNNVWEFARHKKDGSEGGHATPKPINLCERAIKSSSEKNNVILDMFGGSGSTLIAAEKLDRACYMTELDPHYCDVIVNRYVKWCAENNRNPEILHNGQLYEKEILT